LYNPPSYFLIYSLKIEAAGSSETLASPTEFHEVRAQKTIILNHDFPSYRKGGINISLEMLIRKQEDDVGRAETELSEDQFLYLLTLYSLGYMSNSFSYL
jgi:hypothetical protein